MVASDTLASWGGITCGSEDPFMWIDRRGSWHVLYHWMHAGGPGGHSFSSDGITWSNISSAYGGARPLAGGGSASFAAERPKFLFADDGVTPTYLYNGVHDGPGAHTIASPLRSSGPP